MSEVVLETEEVQLIAATLFMMQRVMGNNGLAQHLARQFLSPVPNFSRADAEVICAALGALQRQIRTDTVLTRGQRESVIARAQTIINKLERSHERTPAVL